MRRGRRAMEEESHGGGVGGYPCARRERERQRSREVGWVVVVVAGVCRRLFVELRRGGTVGLGVCLRSLPRVRRVPPESESGLQRGGGVALACLVIPCARSCGGRRSVCCVVAWRACACRARVRGGGKVAFGSGQLAARTHAVLLPLSLWRCAERREKKMRKGRGGGEEPAASRVRKERGFRGRKGGVRPLRFAAAVCSGAWSAFACFEGKCACAFSALVCARGRSKVRRAVLVAKKRRARLVPPGVRRPDRSTPCEVAEWSLWSLFVGSSRIPRYRRFLYSVGVVLVD